MGDLAGDGFFGAPAQHGHFTRKVKGVAAWVPLAFALLLTVLGNATFDATGQMAARDVLVSKMGLATGPLAGAILAQATHYDLLINLGVGVLIASAVTALLPARSLDREQHL